jgi:very-short-patch-repair endonuclease
MADAVAAETLRGIVLKTTLAIAELSTGVRLDDDLVRAGLPPSTVGGSKPQRAASSAASIPADQLRDVVVGLLNQGSWLSAHERIVAEDCIWADESHPHIEKRTRRDIARQLPAGILADYFQQFRVLLGALFDLGQGEIFLLGNDRSLGGQIDQHFHRNDDWTVEELFDALGAVDASHRRFGLLLEGLVSGETVPDEPAQRLLVEAVNAPLAAAGLELRETGVADGYPVFELVAIRSRSRKPKQLIFGSARKPDLRLIDAIDNDLEVVDHHEDVLVYDRPIGAAGLRWRDLQAWWKDTRHVEDDAQAKRELWQRLRRSLPSNAPHQERLFVAYHQIYSDVLPDLPALLPEVWRHWDPKTVKVRGKDALLQFRMDFLLLAPAGARIVLEVDGQTHYASEREVRPGERRWSPDGDRYAHTMSQTRDLALAGYEVHRFGTSELEERNADEVRAMLTAFFDNLFRRHRIAVPSRTA